MALLSWLDKRLWYQMYKQFESTLPPLRIFREIHSLKINMFKMIYSNLDADKRAVHFR